MVCEVRRQTGSVRRGSFGVLMRRTLRFDVAACSGSTVDRRRSGHTPSPRTSGGVVALLAAKPEHRAATENAGHDDHSYVPGDCPRTGSFRDFERVVKEPDQPRRGTR